MDKRPGTPVAILLPYRKLVKGWNQYMKDDTVKRQRKLQKSKMRPCHDKPLDRTAPKPELPVGLQLLHSRATVQSHRVPFSKGVLHIWFNALVLPSEILNNFILGPVSLSEVLWNNGVGL